MLRLIKLLTVLVFSAGFFAVLLSPVLFLEDEPILGPVAPPSAQDVATTRQLLHKVRAATNNNSPDKPVMEATTEELNSAVRLGSRMIDGFRGRVTTTSGAVAGQVSVPVPWIGSVKWLNVSGRIPAFSGEMRVEDLRVGPTPVNGHLALGVARIAANAAVGDKFGDKVVGAVSQMIIDNEQLTFRLTLDEVGKNGVMRGIFGQLRGSEMPTQDQVLYYEDLIRTAMADGILQDTGSFLPYLRFTLATAVEDATEETAANIYTAAIFGLAKVCGARDFSVIVGRLAFDSAAPPQNRSASCDALTFNDRIDSRRHFVTAAALQAASNSGVAISIGEFKELYDTISGAGGFDFTDMAANLSGIRLSDVLTETPFRDWPALIAKLNAEDDVLVPFSGIPQIMTKDAFKARYTDVNSTAYLRQIEDIEARIDELDLYRAQ